MSSVVQPRYHVPYVRMKPLKQALYALQSVITSVDQATNWVHNLVITGNKNGSRLRLEPKPLNQAIKCEGFQIPTHEECRPSCILLKYSQL